MSDLSNEKLRAMAATARNCDYAGDAADMQAMAGELLRLRGAVIAADEVRAEVISAFTRGLSIDDIATRAAEKLAGRAVVALGTEERNHVEYFAEKMRPELPRLCEILDRLLSAPPAASPDPHTCPVHDGELHGAEAEELRAGVEALIEQYMDGAVPSDKLQRLLDRVNARDSLAHLERQDAQEQWRCPADSNECSIRRECTNKCGRKDSAAKVDPELCRRLAAECREDDERMTRAPWEVRGNHGLFSADPGPNRHYQTQAVTSTPDYGCNLPAIARTRNNLAAIAAQLDAAAEMEEQHRAYENSARHWKDAASRMQSERDDARRARLLAEMEAQDVRAERDSILARLRALLVEPAVSEERCAEIERMAAGKWDFVQWLLAGARQLHTLIAGLREVCGEAK